MKVVLFWNMEADRVEAVKALGRQDSERKENMMLTGYTNSP